ncbi:FAD binding domain-containing protein [Thozetella sp. PMI_491]|nr:FAD binding domain-containing protein [Thozetella sp. PMI_491]
MATASGSAEKAQATLASLEPLIKQIKPDEVFTQSDEGYALHTQLFAGSLDVAPTVAFAPASTDSLAKILGFVYKSGLKFIIRGQGFHSLSAPDVVISTLRFTAFEYDPLEKLATIGVANTWIEVATKMKEADPKFSLPVARTAGVGVGGSILHGGLSWMTHEFGLISDPVNMINAEVVKYDGSVVMAADEPDLMWALRGGGGGFGVMTKVVLRAHYYPTDIWSGMILVPRTDLKEVARHASGFLAKPQHPKISLMIYLIGKHMLRNMLDEKDLEKVKGDMIAFHVYDACGEAHGRDAFRWALELPGAIDRTLVTDTKGVVDMQRNVANLRGTLKRMYATTMTVPVISEETIMRVIAWQDEIAEIDPEIRNRSLVAIEGFVLRPPIGGQSETAWFRRWEDKHYVLILTGAPAHGTDEQDARASKIIQDTPGKVFGAAADFRILPAGLDEWDDPKETFDSHWERLVELRKRYDPDLKFKAPVNP